MRHNHIYQLKSDKATSLGVHIITHECLCGNRMYEVLIDNEPATARLFAKLENAECRKRIDSAEKERIKTNIWLDKQIKLNLDE